MSSPFLPKAAPDPSPPQAPAEPTLARPGSPWSRLLRSKVFPERCAPSTARRQTGVSRASGCFRQRLTAPILRSGPPEVLTRTSSSGSGPAQLSWARGGGGIL